MLYQIRIRHADGSIIADDEGSEFGSAEEALENVRRSAGEMIGERLRFGKSVPYRAFELADTKGNIIETITPEDVIRWAAGRLDPSS